MIISDCSLETDPRTFNTSLLSAVFAISERDCAILRMLQMENL